MHRQTIRLHWGARTVRHPPVEDLREGQLCADGQLGEHTVHDLVVKEERGQSLGADGPCQGENKTATQKTVESIA